MRFLPERRAAAFARSLDAMLTAADAPAAVRAWAAGRARAAAGAVVPARRRRACSRWRCRRRTRGVGLLPVELAVAFVELGRHAVPGPLVETVAAAALLTRLAELGDAAAAKRLLPGAGRRASRRRRWPWRGPYALDADAADVRAGGVGRGRRCACCGAPGHGPLPPPSTPSGGSLSRCPEGRSSPTGPQVAAAAARRRSTWAAPRHRRAGPRRRARAARPDRGLRQAAHPVRRRRRLLPGGQAPARGRADRAGVRPPAAATAPP